MSRARQRAREAVEGFTEGEQFEEFQADPEDFLSARERGGGTAGTRIEQQTAALTDAAEIINRSFPEREASGQFVNAVSPVVIPNRQSLFWRLLPIGLLLIFVLLGILAAIVLGSLPQVGALALVVFGPHFWLLLSTSK